MLAIFQARERQSIALQDLASEGRAQVDDFLTRHRGWTADTGYLPDGVGRAAGGGFLFAPKHDGCDGFFLARLTAPC